MVRTIRGSRTARQLKMAIGIVRSATRQTDAARRLDGALNRELKARRPGSRTQPDDQTALYVHKIRIAFLASGILRIAASVEIDDLGPFWLHHVVGLKTTTQMTIFA